jgi:hypothetical protein
METLVSWGLLIFAWFLIAFLGVRDEENAREHMLRTWNKK